MRWRVPHGSFGLGRRFVPGKADVAQKMVIKPAKRTPRPGYGPGGQQSLGQPGQRREPQQIEGAGKKVSGHDGFLSSCVVMGC